jgi:RimJ/RimL family protein N-acetyltransferase
MFYYDENLNSKRAVSPNMIQINTELGGNKYRGLAVDFPDQWLYPKNSFKDLRLYNQTGNPFPALKDPYSLSFFKPSDENNYLKLLFDKSFQLDFYGSNTFPKEKVSNLTEHVEVHKTLYGRRLGIEWIIRENENFIGFVRMTCIKQEDPYNWYIEFGLLKEKRGKGIMRNVFDAVLLWCKRNGLDKVYAVCETFNTTSQRLISGCSVPYKNKTNTYRIPAYDVYAGSRENYKYELFL